MSYHHLIDETKNVDLPPPAVKILNSEFCNGKPQFFLEKLFCSKIILF